MIEPTHSACPPVQSQKRAKPAAAKCPPRSPLSAAPSQPSELSISASPAASALSSLPLGLGDINPSRNPIEQARYPLTPPQTLHKLAQDALTNLQDPEQAEWLPQNTQVVKALLLNPNTADPTLGQLAAYLINDAHADKNLLYTVINHPRISPDSLSAIAAQAENKPGLERLRQSVLSLLSP